MDGKWHTEVPPLSKALDETDMDRWSTFVVGNEHVFGFGSEEFKCDIKDWSK